MIVSTYIGTKKTCYSMSKKEMNESWMNIIIVKLHHRLISWRFSFLGHRTTTHGVSDSDWFSDYQQILHSQKMKLDQVDWRLMKNVYPCSTDHLIFLLLVWLFQSFWMGLSNHAHGCWRERNGRGHHSRYQVKVIEFESKSQAYCS